jgi:hypothetical protein
VNRSAGPIIVIAGEMSSFLSASERWVNIGNRSRLLGGSASLTYAFPLELVVGLQARGSHPCLAYPSNLLTMEIRECAGLKLPDACMKSWEL